MSPPRAQACLNGFYFTVVGLRGCELDLATPNSAVIDFFLYDSYSRARVAVQRTVTVLERCAAWEARCEDLACSVGGICLGSALRNAPPLPAPTLELLPVALAPAGAPVVAVPAGTPYAACLDTSVPAASLCEPGARDLSLTCWAGRGARPRGEPEAPPLECARCGCAPLDRL